MNDDIIINIISSEEQQQIAYRCFISNTQHVLRALNKDISLIDLATSCTPVCCHICTNNYGFKTCNVDKWIHILIEIDNACVLSTRINAFLDYILLQHSERLSLSKKIQKVVLFNTSFYQYEIAKDKIIKLLESGYDIEGLLNNLNSIKDSDDSFSYIRNWLPILKKAKDEDIIPGGNLLEFLKFI
jgi:hypothetical protein